MVAQLIRRWCGALAAAVAVGFLVIGWWPFTPSPRNRVTWLANQPGLSFEPPGVAYSNGSLLSPGSPPPAAFAIELFLAPRGGPRAASQYILSLHDGGLPSAVAICQWKSELLVRIPDAANVRGFREVAVAALDGPTRLITIVCSQMGTEVFVDGVSKRRFPHFVVPGSVWRGKLVLGDAAGGKQAWSGEIFGLAFLRDAPDSETIARRHRAWQSRDAAGLRGDVRVAALFAFGERNGTSVADASPLQARIEIPMRYQVVQKQAFSLPLNRWEFWQAGRRDAVLNLIGFVPFGIFVFVWASNPSASNNSRALALAVLAGLGLSAVIETGQVWLPTRVSSATDLILNTTGSGCGGWLASWLVRRADVRRWLGDTPR